MIQVDLKPQLRSLERLLFFQRVYAWSFCDEQAFEEFPGMDLEETDKELNLFADLPASLVHGVDISMKNLEKSCPQLDCRIVPLLRSWRLERLARVDLAILRMSVFSLLYQREVPPLVTINEAVKLAKHFGEGKSYRFVNGILHQIWKSLTVGE